ncbi:MAG: hypothetical protein IJA10_02075 [Lachnospiraceae bacterium]|nr:hypothetical protein [Lachnospiraceae bacterium]
MKKCKILLCISILAVCLLAGFFLPDIVFCYIDEKELNHVKEQTAEDSSFVLSNKSSIDERLSVFGDGYEVIDTVMSEGERENVLKAAQEELGNFLDAAGYDISLEQAYSVDITKHIYSSNEKDIYSFAAYLVEVEYAECDIDFILDMESQMILQLKFDFTDFVNMLCTEDGKQWTKENGYGYYGILNKIMIETMNYGECEMLLPLLCNYYDGFQIEIVGSSVSNTSAAVFVSEKDVKDIETGLSDSIKEYEAEKYQSDMVSKKITYYGESGGGSNKFDYVFVCYFIDVNRELTFYNIRVTENSIIFNDVR